MNATSNAEEISGNRDFLNRLLHERAQALSLNVAEDEVRARSATPSFSKVEASPEPRALPAASSTEPPQWAPAVRSIPQRRTRPSQSQSMTRRLDLLERNANHNASTMKQHKEHLMQIQAVRSQSKPG